LTGGSGASGASGASGGLFYFMLTFPPNSSQAKNYVRLNLHSEDASKLSINGSRLTTSGSTLTINASKLSTSASELSINGSEAHHKSSWSSEMMAEHSLRVFALVNPMVERSPRVLTHRLDLGDMGDMGDVRMAVFHFFHRQKMYCEIGFILPFGPETSGSKERIHPKEVGHPR